MKLATRMSCEIGACAVVLFGGSGLLQLRQEERDLRAVARSEALLLGEGLQKAFQNALRDQQLEDVTETLVGLAHVDPAVVVFVYDDKGSLVGSSRDVRPSTETSTTEGLARNKLEPVVEFDTDGPRAVLRIGLRLGRRVPSRSTIVLEKPLAELKRDLLDTRRDIAVTTLGFILAVAGLTWLLARRYVGLPLGRLVENMKRVGAGDLRVDSARRSTDEVGEAQEEFARLVAQLKAVGERADDELEARRRMESSLQNADKLITLGQLSAVMAHEVGSPLQVLEGRARSLRKHADEPEATRRTADLLVEQVGRITRIVGQMLSITRRRPPLPSRIDAEASVRSVVALLEFEGKRRRVGFTVERCGPTDVVADGDQLQQVMLNLMRNALQASPPDTTVIARIGGDEANLVLEVHDDGPGITPSARSRVFDAFFTTRADAGGTGLGLSVVKSIVEAHNGSIEFAADGAPGCTVRLSLPRTAEGVKP